MMRCIFNISSAQIGTNSYFGVFEDMVIFDNDMRQKNTINEPGGQIGIFANDRNKFFSVLTRGNTVMCHVWSLFILPSCFIFLLKLKVH